MTQSHSKQLFSSKQDEDFFIQIERALLHQLIYLPEDDRKLTLDKCTKLLFYHKQSADLFSIIQTTKDCDMLKLSTIASAKFNYSPLEVIEWIESPDFRYRNADDLIYILKSYLFTRVSDTRAINIRNIVEHDALDTARERISEQATKILTLNKSLFRPSRVNNTDELVRLTTKAVNSSDDIVLSRWNPLDRRTGGFTRRGISTILAHSSNMKSTVGDFLISNAVQNTPNLIGMILSLEDAVEKRVTRIVASRLNLSLTKIRFKEIKITEQQIESVLRGMLDSRLIIFDPRHCFGTSELVAAIEEYKPGIVLVDHIQKLGEDDPIHKILDAVDKIERACIKSNTHGIITSQIPDKQFANRVDKQPKTSDSQWNSVLLQSSTEMLSLYYPFFFTKNQFQKEHLHIEILKAKFLETSEKFLVQINPDKAQILDEIEVTNAKVLR